MKALLADRRKAAAAVFFLALILRLGYLWRVGPPAEILGDSIEYHGYATRLLDTGTYSGALGERATRMPGYPLFLAAVYALTGRSVLAALIAQCVLGALTCVLLFGLAEEIFPAPWPLWAGLAAAVYGGLIAPCSALLSECVYSFFLVASVRALYKKAWPAGARVAVFGLLSGCLYLVRPEPLPYIVTACLLLPVIFPGFGWRETVKGLAAAALVIGLWVGRNYAVFHRVIPASTVGKSVGYLSLYLPAHRLGLAPEDRHAPPLEAGELERDWSFAQAYKRLSGRLTWGQLVKCYALNLSLILYPFLPEYDWTYVFLFPFFLAGAALAARRKGLWPIAGAVACSLSVFIFFGGPASRYRQGIAPFMILLGAAAFDAAAGRWGKDRLFRWAGAWLGVNLLVWAGQAQFRLLVLQLLGSGVRAP